MPVPGNNLNSSLAGPCSRDAGTERSRVDRLTRSGCRFLARINPQGYIVGEPRVNYWAESNSNPDHFRPLCSVPLFTSLVMASGGYAWVLQSYEHWPIWLKRIKTTESTGGSATDSVSRLGENTA